VLGGLAGALGTEVALRLLAPECFGQVLANLPGKYRFRTAQADVGVYINRLGMRGPETSLAKPSGVVRILCIGDSTTWGESVEWEHTYPMVAVRAVAARRPQLSVEMLNLSKPGAGLRDYSRYWRETGRNLDPDIVVVGFFLGNDMFSIRDPYAVVGRPMPAPGMLDWIRSRVRWRVDVAKMIWSRWADTERDIFDLWFGSSPEDRARTSPLRLENLVERAALEGTGAEIVRRRLDALPGELVQDALQHRIDPWLVSAAVIHPGSIEDSEREDLPLVEESWEAALAALDSLLAEIRDAGARTVVLAIPRAVHVDRRYGVEFAELGFSIPENISKSSVAASRLVERLAGTDTIAVDPLGALRAFAAGSEERLYFRFDVHLTATGNRILGDELVETLLRLLPR
jgi:hypothetical protein